MQVGELAAYMSLPKDVVKNERVDNVLHTFCLDTGRAPVALINIEQAVVSMWWTSC